MERVFFDGKKEAAPLTTNDRLIKKTEKGGTHLAGPDKSLMNETRPSSRKIFSVERQRFLVDESFPATV